MINILEFLLGHQFQFCHAITYEKYGYLQFLENHEIVGIEGFKGEPECYWELSEKDELVLLDAEKQPQSVLKFIPRDEAIGYFEGSSEVWANLPVKLFPSQLDKVARLDMQTGQRVDLFSVLSSYELPQREQARQLLAQDYVVDGQKDGLYFALPRAELEIGLENYHEVYYQLIPPLDATAYLSPKLLVYFTGFTAANTGIARENYLTDGFARLPESLAKNTYLLKIADSNLLNGSYWLNTANFPDFEPRIQELIAKIAEENGVPKANIVLFGNSKGGFGALYHGLLGNYPIVSMDPVVDRTPFCQKRDYHLMFDFIPVSFVEKLNVLLEKTALRKDQIKLFSSGRIKITFPYISKLNQQYFELWSLNFDCPFDPVEYVNFPLGAQQHASFIVHNVPLMIAAINDFLYEIDMRNVEINKELKKMTVYNLNQGIGWASSGVEYAQMYRDRAFNALNVPRKFIFTDFISAENIAEFTANLGYRDEDIIWLYQYFSDIPVTATTFTCQDLLKELDSQPERQEKTDNYVRYFYESKNAFVTAYFSHKGDPYLLCSEHVSNGSLLRKDFYAASRIFSEYFRPKDGQAKIYQRSFYNKDGSVALAEMIDDDNKSIHRVNDRIFYFKEDLIAYFLRCLKLTDKDVLIVDRSTGMGRAVLENKGEAKVGVVVHADHFAKNMTNDQHILWNNYYEYEFMQARNIDFYVNSTDAQTETLRAQFDKYYDYTPRILTIPVGSLDQLYQPEIARKPFSMITASRLADEKHIDWLVAATAKAKKEIPELTLDIYGEGGTRKLLEDKIADLGAGDYISLKGHHDLEKIYPDYELYLAGSTSEGFGLTLMEAVGSGLMMIGFDVPYGNQTFIENGKNGYLVPFEEDDSMNRHIEQLAEKISQVFKQSSEQLAQMHEASYKLAEGYLLENVQKQWADLLESLQV